MGTLVKLKAPSCSVWFGNLNSKVTDKHLLELGTQAGPVTRASRSKDASYGFLEYADVESAIYCVGMYNGVLKLFGQPVSVDFSNRAVPDLKPEEQGLLDRCLKLINAAHYINGNAGAVRRGGREAQRFTPYGDARGHREQRAAMRAPTRFNDDYTDAAYGATDAAAGYDKSAEAGQAYSWPAAAAAPAAAPAAPPVQLDSNALAAMQAAAVAAAAATGLGGRPAAQQPPQQPQQHVQVQVQPSAWPGAVPAASAPTFVQLPHAAPGAQAVVIVQQQPQQPPQQPHATYQQAHVYQQSQQHQQMVQHVPAAAPQDHQPQQQHAYQAVQQVGPAAAAYQQQWQYNQQQQQQYYQPVQQQGQYAVQQQVQYAQPAAAPANGAFQSSMPGAVQGQYQYQAAGAGQYAQPQQQQGTWYYQ